MLASLLVPLSAGRAQGPANDKKDPPRDAKRDEDLRKELLRMEKEDQAARKQFLEWMSKQGQTDTDAVKKLDIPEMRKMAEIDRNNTKRMKEIVDKHGWPGKSLVGEDGAQSAWLLVQHADADRDFQKHCLTLMKAAPKGEVSSQNLAYLTDRVLVGEKKKQLYGTQFHQRDGELVPQPIEDEVNVDKRRKEVGLQPLAEYKKLMQQMYKKKGDDKK
jgi:hypothetical protein